MIRFQFVTHTTDKYSYADGARLALEGGCRWIQLRAKNLSDEEILPIAHEVQWMCREYGATFIIDDRVEMVKRLNADGVHLGKSDMPVDEARKILGQSFIIGGTANNIEDVRLHYSRGADYIGCGPFRFTSTKANLSPILGLDGYSRIIRAMDDEAIRIPIVAIGGIRPTDVEAILNTGVTGVAVSGSILNADSPPDTARNILNIIRS